MRFVEFENRVSREGAGLVEAALSPFTAMQGNGHNEQLRRSFESELRNSGCEHCAKPLCSGVDAIVLERVDGGAQGTIICPERDGTHEGRRREAAGPAEA